MDTASQSPASSVEPAKDRLAWNWIDFGLLGLFLVIGLFLLRATPEFAANLPQDSFDYAVPALNYLERGSMTISCYGREHPAGHTVGMALFLVPVYWLCGHFIGNGIHFITLCALGSVVAVYWLGRSLHGRLAGTLAALFLITHHGFAAFSKKIMAEVPSILLLLVCLILLVQLYREKRRIRVFKAMLLGTTVGVATLVRTDNLLVLIPIVLVLLLAGGFKTQVVRWCVIAAGVLPWLVVILAYNHIHCSSAFWSGQQYWGNHATKSRPLFSIRYWARAGYSAVHPNVLANVLRVNGNCDEYAYTLLSQADGTLTFTDLETRNLRWTFWYQCLVGWRTVLGLIGFAVCNRFWHRNSAARPVVDWTWTFTLAVFVTFASYWWQDERYFLRLVPFFCILNGVGAASLLSWVGTASGRIRIVATAPAVALVAMPLVVFGYNNQKGFINVSDDDLRLYQEFREADKTAESNAVVVTSFDHFRPDIFLVRGKQRTCVPFSETQGGGVIYPSRNADPVTPYSFAAVENPGALAQWLREGRPVYVLLREPFEGNSPESALAGLARDFEWDALHFVQREGKVMPCFFRLKWKSTAPVPATGEP